MKRLKGKGGIDTIVAYAVCSLPLIYMLIYLVCTFIHFTTQSYIDQVVKETLVLVSTTGKIDNSIIKFANDKLVNFDTNFNIQISKSYYNSATSTFSAETKIYEGQGAGISGGTYSTYGTLPITLNRGDILKMKVKSANPSILSRVGGHIAPGGTFYYYSMREEVVQSGKIN